MEKSLSGTPGKNLSASHASEIVPSRKLSQWSFAKLAGCLLYFYRQSILSENELKTEYFELSAYSATVCCVSKVCCRITGNIL